MKIIDTMLEGVKIIEPKIFGDHRGYFFESWNCNAFEQGDLRYNFIQDNESLSGCGVLRGLHYQAAPYTQAKLVRVIAGEVLDVAVDIRRNSPTFAKHVAVILSGDNKRQLLIPRGFAHGFAVLSAEAIFAYKCDNIYMPQYERGIIYNDNTLGIDWRLDEASLILSGKDIKLPGLYEAELFNLENLEYLL